MDIYQGDPKLYLDEDGASIVFNGGQPIMESGKANVALISLFTAPGWCGNVYARSEKEKIGSVFEETVNKPITFLGLNDIRDTAEKAMTEAGFLDVSAEVKNPEGHKLNIILRAEDTIGTEYTFDAIKLVGG